MPDSNSEVGAVEMGILGEEQGVLRVRLFIDGKRAWRHVLKTPPVGGRGSDDAL